MLLWISLLTHYFCNDKFNAFAERPKIFILNCCRGNIHYRTKITDNASSERTDAIVSDDFEWTEPKNATPRGDMYIVWSTTNSRESMRDPDKGSPLIQTLCDEIEKTSDDGSIGSIEFTQLMNNVRHRIKEEHQEQMETQNALARPFYIFNTGT